MNRLTIHLDNIPMHEFDLTTSIAIVIPAHIRPAAVERISAALHGRLEPPVAGTPYQIIVRVMGLDAEAQAQADGSILDD